ncbi:MAG: hypothetical protein ABI846_04545, partial [Rudaea sp.]
DQGQGPVARAQSLKIWGDAEQRRLTQAVGGAVKIAYQRMSNAHDRVQDYRTQIIPQRQTVVARTQEEQNFMLVGVFELFAVKRAEFDAYQGYLNALRDYWTARADLERAVGACLPSDAHSSTEAISTQQLLTPPPAMSGMQHMHHGSADRNDMPGMQMPMTKPSEEQAPKKSPGKHGVDAADHEHHGDMP